MKSEMIYRIEAVRDGRSSVEQIARQRLHLVERENPRVNALVEYHPEEFISQAKKIDEKASQGKAGKLAGAIITVKDNLDVRGMKSTAGMVKLKNNIAEKDCDVVGKLRVQDALILGKTNMPPGAMDVQSDNPVYGRTNHPLFPERTCGGSSGGGACAVTLGMSDMDIGNDIMGSIRIPSHFCGIYGFLPTENCITIDSLAGSDPMGNTLTHMIRIGIQTKEIENISYVLPLVQKTNYPAGPQNGTSSQLKIAYSFDCGGLPLSSASRECVEAFLGNIATAHDLCEIGTDDYDFEMARQCFLHLMYGAISSMLPSFACFILKNILQQKYMNNKLKDYLHAENDREECIRQMENLLDRFDCLITPVSATPAFLHRRPDRMQGIQPIYDSFEMDGIKTQYATANLGYTTPFLTGAPIISMPIGVTGEGLPVGIQVIGRQYREYTLFDIVQRLRNG